MIVMFIQIVRTPLPESSPFARENHLKILFSVLFFLNTEIPCDRLKLFDSFLFLRAVAIAAYAPKNLHILFSFASLLKASGKCGTEAVYDHFKSWRTLKGSGYKFDESVLKKKEKQQNFFQQDYRRMMR